MDKVKKGIVEGIRKIIFKKAMAGDDELESKKERRIENKGN